MPSGPVNRVRAAVVHRLPTPLRRRLRAARRRLRHRTLPSALRHGMVEEFSRSRVSGWVSLTPGHPGLSVVLLVNGVEVARTEAAAPAPGRRDPAGDVRAFRFLLSDIWDFLGPADRIGVAADGRPLPIAGRGMVVAPTERGPRRWRDLRAALAQGQVFSRTGTLQRPLTGQQAWQDDVFAVAGGVRDLLRDRFGLDVFLSYGSLLGAVREGGAIAHDDDLDLGYLSRHDDPAAIGRELYDIALALLDAGWMVEPFGPLVHAVAEIGGVRRWVDLFPHYFDADGALQVPWGMAGRRHVRREEWTGLRDATFGRHTFAVPVAAEATLAQLYGEHWRRPQPGFSWPLDRTEERTDAFMPRVAQEDVYWRDFHRRTVFDEPSPFCRELLRRPDCPPTVVDIGCGDARDAVAFAASGRRVLALERAPIPLQLARSRASELLVVSDCDIADPQAFAAAVAGLSRDDGPVLFYLRFVIHLLSRDAERVLLGAIADAAGPGDVLAAEFRDLADRPLVKNLRTRFRGYRDGREVVAQLRDLGFDVEQADHATGRSPWGVEDPDLWRIVARRAGRSATRRQPTA
ncbi:LicD family protein [Jatrophihabitans endophyticus]|uniref:LicD family protein n=1 Tax=Jatrophihabitans endophyticus TaxID=1206085 RepID=A0A1M5GLU7_9ACTN|nr:class I SAM-dependent methyltransferase [Jatrophihabitans endophyticus]SHG04638.1 LicD family protein [Jatrophihabitans endophyticus]